MSQLVGIVALAGLLALMFFLPRRGWPRAPKWMRLTAVAIALPLAVVAVLLVRAGAEIRDAPAFMPWHPVRAATPSAFKLIAWACIGRVNPRSMQAATLHDARSRPRARSR